jgi:hypothetical protein
MKISLDGCRDSIPALQIDLVENVRTPWRFALRSMIAAICLAIQRSFDEWLMKAR